jgi:chromate transporter
MAFDPTPGRLTPIIEIASLFLRLGATVFGGPAAHIAVMEDEVVRRRRWLTRDEFLDYLGATNLIPGPNSTELALHIGRHRGGAAGLVTAGVSFILPAAIMAGVCAWAYVRWGTLPQLEGMLAGAKPVVLAVIVQALWTLGRTAIKSPGIALLGAAALVAALAGVHEIAVLAATAAAAWLLAAAAAVRGHGGAFISTIAMPSWFAMSDLQVGVWPLFLLFAKIGAVLFGSGYVLIAFLRADLVERLHWLTDQQLLDAIAVGQMTPGPVLTTATFIGYMLSGVSGAVAATVGIFLPAFVFVALSGPLVPWLRRSALAGGALDGVNAASLALMAAVSLQIGRVVLADPVSVAIAAASGVMLYLGRVNSSWLILGGALAGWLVSTLR